MKHANKKDVSRKISSMYGWKKGRVGIAKVQKLFRTTKEVMEPYEYPCPEDKMYIKETF